MKNEEKSTSIKKDKLAIISEMDELKVIANNHLIMKRFPEAIKAAERIINLALEVKMGSVIREQEEFITSIYKILETDKLASIILDDFDNIKSKYQELSKKNKFRDAHNLLSQFKEKYDEYYDVRLISPIKQFLQEEIKRWDCFVAEESSLKLLEPLEIQFNSYIHTNNIPLARDTLEKAKALLQHISLDYIIEKWSHFEAEYLERKKDYQLKGDFDTKMGVIAELTEEYKFQEAHSLLSTLIKMAEEKHFIEYKDKLAAKKRNIEDAERKYKKLLNDITDLEIKLKIDIENEQYESAKDICDQIIKIARFIDQKDLLMKYEKEKETLSDNILEYNRFLALKKNILELSEIAISEVNEEYFSEALDKYKAILSRIQKYLEE
ncbi:MAG: hypothetical protein EU531_09520 [Promethearchaeota archaeon]|nr:MAG: hypothetical protein EU531_09520 [Candidatus Lokiarchaeota archaeon]